MQFAYKELRTYEFCPARFFIQYIQGQQQSLMVEEPFNSDEAIRLAVEHTLNGSSYEKAVETALEKYTFQNNLAKNSAKGNMLQQLNNISPTRENIPGITAINQTFSIQLDSDLVFVGQVDVMGIDNGDPFFFIWKTARPHEVKKTQEAGLIARGAVDLLETNQLIACIMQFVNEPFSVGSGSIKADFFTKQETESAVAWATNLAASIRDGILETNMGVELSQAFPPKASPLCQTCLKKSECQNSPYNKNQNPKEAV